MVWSLDWFTARDEAINQRPIRRVAWAFGTWLRYHASLWWLKTPEHGWRIVRATELGEADLRARDWTTASYYADVCGSLPAFNDTATTRRDWGDGPVMTPVPVPSFPDDIPEVTA
jgi:hypothetical protein